MPIMSKKFTKMLAWKHENDVKFRGHKEHTPNTNYHHMRLNELPSMKCFRILHCAIMITKMSKQQKIGPDCYVRYIIPI